LAGDWKVRDAAIRLGGLVLPIGLELDEATVEGREVAVHTEPFSITLSDDARATVRVSCESIAKFLGSFLGGQLRDVAVSTEGDFLRVAATATVLVPIRASALCRLDVRESVMLDIALVSAEPAGARGLIERQLASVNPVIDVSTLPMNFVIESVEVGEGWVVVHGCAG